MEFVKSTSEIWGETTKVGKVVMVVVVAVVVILGVIALCHSIAHPYSDTQI